jgi:hypothetical protein
VAKRAAAPKVEQTVETPNAADELTTLRAELEAANREKATLASRLQEAETGKSGAERKALSEAERRIQAEISATDSALAANESEAENIVAEIDGAQADGKPTGALQRKLAKIEASSTDLTNRKTFYSNQLKQAEAAAKAPPPREVPKLADGTPLTNFTPALQRWAQSHPELLTSRAAVMRGYAADAEARERGIAVESKEYFDALDEAVSGRPAAQPTVDDDIDDGGTPYSETQPADAEAARVEAEAAIARGAARQPQAGPAGTGSLRAMPSRQVPGNSAQRARTPALTADQREVADSLYAHLKDPRERYATYAEHKAYMDRKQSGAIN